MVLAFLGLGVTLPRGLVSGSCDARSGRPRDDVGRPVDDVWVHAVGVGEGADDLQPFAADEFAKALAGVGVD